MVKKLDHNRMGRSELGWLTSWFHFSFAEYYNPDNMNFGALRVINDDLIKPHTGFDTHPHRDMEIITYVVEGELTHGDSMNNQSTLVRGEVQYMSAGTGVLHSEHNLGNQTLRLLQIWILPDRAAYQPRYGEYRFPWEARVGRWLHLVSGEEGDAPIRIHQDLNLYAAALKKGTLEFSLTAGRQAYFVLIEGEARLNEVPLETRDAAELVEESKIRVETEKGAHFLLFEMARR